MSREQYPSGIECPCCGASNDNGACNVKRCEENDHEECCVEYFCHECCHIWEEDE
jgi:hypothetical protein